MRFSDYIIFGLIGLLFIVRFAYQKVKASYLAKRATKIIKAQTGHLILKGKIQKFDNLISAPLSKKSCCGYLYLVIDRSAVDKVVHSENHGTDFILDDGTGRCLIRPKLAGDFYNAILWPPTIKFSNHLNLEDAIKLNDLSKNPRGKRYRHMEYRRQEGEKIYVEGLYQSNLDNLNLAVLNLNGAVVDAEKTSLTITPAYSGSIIHSSNRGYWPALILNILSGVR